MPASSTNDKGGDAAEVAGDDDDDEGIGKTDDDGDEDDDDDDDADDDEDEDDDNEGDDEDDANDAADDDEDVSTRALALNTSSATFSTAVSALAFTKYACLPKWHTSLTSGRILVSRPIFPASKTI